MWTLRQSEGVPSFFPPRALFAVLCFFIVTADSRASDPTTCFAKTLRFVVGESPAESSSSPRLVVKESGAEQPHGAETLSQAEVTGAAAREAFDAPLEFHSPLVYQAALAKVGRGPLAAFKRSSKLRPRDLDKLYDHFEGLGEAGQERFVGEVYNGLIRELYESNPARIPARARALGVSVPDYGTLMEGLRPAIQDKTASLAALREVLSGGRIREAVEDFVHLEDGLRNPIVYRSLVGVLKGESPRYAPFRVQRELQDAVESYAALSPANQSRLVQRVREKIKSECLAWRGGSLSSMKIPAERMGIKAEAYREHLRSLDVAIAQQDDAVIDEALHGLLTDAPSALSRSMKPYATNRLTSSERAGRAKAAAWIAAILVTANGLAHAHEMRTSLHTLTGKISAPIAPDLSKVKITTKSARAIIEKVAQQNGELRALALAKPVSFEFQAFDFPEEGVTFTVGSPQGETDRFDNESLSKVTFKQDFEIARTEATYAIVQAVLKKKPLYIGENLPASDMTYDEAMEVAARLTEADPEYKYDLLTPDQGEFAQRAGTVTAYPHGDRYDRAQMEAEAWVISNAGGWEHEVATKRPNKYGLYDMIGNLAEWRKDSFVGGGSWNYEPHRLRSAQRYENVPGRYNLLGFRLVRFKK